jgi:hypothetical protein
MAIDAHALHHKVKGKIPANAIRRRTLFHAIENGRKSATAAKKVPETGDNSHAYAAFRVLTLGVGSGHGIVWQA